MRKAACILALATAGATLSATAIPAAAQDTHQIAVAYDDLNLASAAGRAKLQARIAGAARVICGGWSDRTPMETARFNACHADVVARASTQMYAALGSSNMRAAR